MYRIYIDRDGDIWLNKGDRISAYANIDLLLLSHESSYTTPRNIPEVTKRWEMQLLAQGDDLETVAAEAKLELLLRE